MVNSGACVGGRPRRQKTLAAVASSREGQAPRRVDARMAPQLHHSVLPPQRRADAPCHPPKSPGLISRPRYIHARRAAPRASDTPFTGGASRTFPLTALSPLKCPSATTAVLPATASSARNRRSPGGASVTPTGPSARRRRASSRTRRPTPASPPAWSGTSPSARRSPPAGAGFSTSRGVSTLRNTCAGHAPASAASFPWTASATGALKCGLPPTRSTAT